MKEHRGRLVRQDIETVLSKHLNDLFDVSKGELTFFLDRLDSSARRKALDRIGLPSKVARKITAQDRIDEARLEEILQGAFSRVKSLSPEVVSKVRDLFREGFLEGRDTDDILRQLLDETEKETRAGELTGNELKAALQEIWGKIKYDLQRVLRTESINAYSKIQLQEWYDQGIRRVRRHSIDDSRTCATCRELSLPGNNEYDITVLLALDYPVTEDPDNPDAWLTHPNCRCWFQPIIEDNWVKVRELEDQMFSSFDRTGTTIEDVPLDVRESVEKAAKDLDPDQTFKFVENVVDQPEWQKVRLEQLEDVTEKPQDAKTELAKEVSDAEINHWYDSEENTTYISRSASDFAHITVPMTRGQGIKVWDERVEPNLGLSGWVMDRWNQKKAELGMTLENEGIQIFGGEPFFNEIASGSPKDYFIEAYSTYITDPIILQSLDLEMYIWLKDNFFSREYLQHGGLK